jgi:hypothetical protein
VRQILTSAPGTERDGIRHDDTRPASLGNLHHLTVAIKGVMFILAVVALIIALKATTLKATAG